MPTILANDGLHQAGIEKLQKAGFNLLTDKVEQEVLVDFINQNNVEVLLVRSATKVREPLINACPNLKIIGRGGVGLDNIDVKYAEANGIKVVNTPAASSQSVAELVLAHMFTLSRYLHNSNRIMPKDGNTDFKILKKAYGKGSELSGKTLGIIGFGRIGQTTAKMAIGIGMKVLPYDPIVKKATVDIDFLNMGEPVSVEFETVDLNTLYAQADYITLHVPMPANGKSLISDHELSKIKQGCILINTSRGGIIDENALLKALENGTIAMAGLDVFENEPQPADAILNHSKISLSPHIGGSTQQAQARIGEELAEKIITLLA